MTEADRTADAAGPPPAEPAPPGNRRRVQWKLVARYSARLMLIAVMLWFAGWMLLVFNEFRHGSTAMDRTIALPPPESAVALQISDFLDGQWSFADSPTAMSIANVEASQLDARMAALSGAAASPRRAPRTDDTRLLAWLRQMGLKPQPQDGYRVYRLAETAVRLTAFASGGDGDEHIVLMRLATPASQGRWLVIETQNMPAGSTASDAAALLPTPPSAQRIGTRRDQQGRAVCDVFQVKSRIEAAPAYWQQQGWQLVEAPGTDPPARQWRCQRGGDAWIVWLHRESNGSGRILAIRETAAVTKE